MFHGHVQVGFDLRFVRHYATSQDAQRFVEKTLSPLIAQGVVFNVIIVTQRKGGNGPDAEDPRYIPLLNCWRVPRDFAGTEVSAMSFAARKGFVCFA